MKYLFIDTCTSNLIISLIIDNKIVGYYNNKIDKGMSNYVLKEIEKQFNENGINPRDIDTIFVTTGPGSFTGIRVGLSIAKVYAWGLNIKVVPLSSLEVISSSLDENVVSIIDARRDTVFLGVYDSNLNNIIEDKYCSIEELKKYDYKIVSYDSFDSINTIFPNINVLKIVEKHKNDKGINPHMLNPNYLKKTEAEEKLECKC